MSLLSYITLAVVLSCSFAVEENISPRMWPCPDVKAFEPCICTENSAEYIMDADCSGAKTDQDLINAFASDFSFLSFRKLLIDHTLCVDCSLYELSAGMFNGVSFTDIRIVGTSVEIVDEGAFSDSHTSLEAWHMDNNKLTAFPFESITSYTKIISLTMNRNEFPPEYIIQPIESATLRTLNLAYNKELNISESLVQLCSDLRVIHLNSIDLVNIPQYPESPISMFAGLENLTKIYLNNNKIPVLNSDIILATGNSLTELDLSSNSIISDNIDPEFVKGWNPSVGCTLNLTNNQITYLDENTWRPVFTAMHGNEVIDMSLNPLTCGCDIDWIVLNTTMLNLLTTSTTCHTDEAFSIYDVDPNFVNATCTAQNLL